MNILIVEECPFEGGTLAEMVLSQGYSLLGHVGSFEEAAVLLKDSKPDLCIYDDKPKSGSHNWQWLFEIITKEPLPLVISAKEVRPEIKQVLGYYVHLPKPTLTKNLNDAVLDSITKFRKRETLNFTGNNLLSDRIFIKNPMNNYKCLIINDIMWAKGEGNYTRVVTRNQSYLIRIFLGDFLKRMTTNHFARTHKSYIVNLCLILEIRVNNVLIGNTEIPLSKFYRTDLLTRFQTY